ncbi:MAG: hypothetical protein HKP01_07685 [Gemmatimonadetes bacterium]|nr:hypothetical protein [Gemmatimonadota bacterium]
MTPAEVRAAQQAGAAVLDLRTPHPFAAEHLEGALSVQFNRADLVDRVELVFPEDLPMIMHGEPEAIGKVDAKLLADAGFIVLGHLEGGLKAWKAEGLPVVQLPTMDVDELKERMDEFTVVDARDPFEFKYGHVPGSGILSWTEAWYEADKAVDDPPIAVICGDEIRSVLVASILARKGKSAELVTGGMVDWIERDYPIEKGMG